MRPESTGARCNTARSPEGVTVARNLSSPLFPDWHVVFDRYLLQRFPGKKQLAESNCQCIVRAGFPGLQTIGTAFQANMPTIQNWLSRKSVSSNGRVSSRCRLIGCTERLTRKQAKSSEGVRFCKHAACTFSHTALLPLSTGIS
jgi:hypothetical protein